MDIWYAQQALNAEEVIYVHADNTSHNSSSLLAWLREKISEL